MNAISIKDAAAAAGRNMTKSEKFVYRSVHSDSGAINTWFEYTAPLSQVATPRYSYKARDVMGLLGNAIRDIESSYREGPNAIQERPTLSRAVDLMTYHVSELFRAGFVLDCIDAKQVLHRPAPHTEALAVELLDALNAIRAKYKGQKAISREARDELRAIQQRLLIHYRLQASQLHDPDECRWLSESVEAATEHFRNGQATAET